MKIIIAITAASGSLYARQLLEHAIADINVTEIALVCSDNALEVAAYEGVTLPSSEKIRAFSNHDMFASVASGSAGYDAMVVLPCTVGTVGRIASGVSDSLICRAADVMLKERRRLILVVREAPYSLIHLRNMTTITEAGGVIFPASPSMYSHPRDMEELAQTVSSRVARMVGIASPLKEWGAGE
ncbi:MAG: UbiX family flavin prenyltransferase [Rikenellaceae bacterium]